MDSKNGYDYTTKTYHSLFPSIDLPPEALPLSAANFALSFLSSASITSLDTTPVFIDSATGHSLSLSEFLCRVHSLAHSLSTRNQSSFKPLAKGQVALILSPWSLNTPVLYFALLSLGIVIFPVDPLSNELDRLVTQATPAIVFTLSSLLEKVDGLPYSFPCGTIFLDSLEFDSMLKEVQMSMKNPKTFLLEYSTPVSQLDSAAMITSSSTTGPAKIAELTHPNMIAFISGHANVGKADNIKPTISLLTTIPGLILGFVAMVTNVAMGRTMVLLERCRELGAIMESLERYKVEVLYAYPSLVGAMAAAENTEIVDKYDVSSFRFLMCGGMQIHDRHFNLFKNKFPNANVLQAYGMTEIAGAAVLQLGAANDDDQCSGGTCGLLLSHLVARIVDPSTGEALPPGCRGDLWLRGPTVMKGYVEDEELTAKRLDSKEGWLKTGDLCYFDSNGFLHFVERLKELITINSHQVSPTELERVLLLHPEIEDAVVAPYPEDGGEVPVGLVIRKHGSTITESQVIDFVATKVEEYKKIKHVRFITTLPNFGKENFLPISQQGKIKRKLLLQGQYIASN